MTPHTSLPRTFVAAILAAFALLAISAIVANTASATAGCPTNGTAPLAGSNFEAADGNMCDPDGTWRSGTDDWETAPTTSLTDPTGNKSDTIFGPGDTNSIVSGSQEQVPDSWQLTRGNPGGPSFNLLASWTQPDPNPLLCQALTCDLFVYLGLIRQAANGSTDLAFELNRKQAGYRQSPGVADPTSIPPTTVGEFGVPTRSEGDALITYDISGTTVTVGMCLWHGDEHQGKWKLLAAAGDPTGNADLSDNVNADSTNAKTCTPLNGANSTGTAQGSLNDSAITDTQNFFSSTPGTLDLSAGQFGEAGVNVTRTLATTAGQTPCVNFGSAWVHTRASDAITSSQKDWMEPQPVVIASCPSVTIKKETLPDEPNNSSTFSYTSNLPANDNGTGSRNRSFSLHDDGTEGPISIPAGSYSVSEGTIPNGYHLDHVDCTDPTNTPGGQNNTGANDPANPQTVSINASGTENITCTYYNAKDAKLTIAKDASPDSSQTFGFSASGSGIAQADQSFSLFDDGTDPNNTEHTKVLNFSAGQFGQKVIHEAPQSGWDLSAISCPNASVDYSSDGQSFHATFASGDTYARVTVGAGDDITCTYTNTKQATLTVAKNAVPDSSQTFGFSASGSGIAQADQSFSLFDDGNDPNNTEHAKVLTFGAGQFGQKTISETPQSGWDLSQISCPNASVDFSSDGQSFHGSFTAGDTIARVAVGAGDNVVCTYTNTKVAKLTVVKNAVPDSSQTFAFGASGAGVAQADRSFSLFDDGNDPNGNEHTKGFTFHAGDFGQKIITETPQSDWDLSSISCPNASVDFSSDGGQSWHGTFTAGDTKARVLLAAGDDVTCTYTNTKVAKLTVVKNAVPDSSQTFGFSASGNGVSQADQNFSLFDDGNDANGDEHTKTLTFHNGDFGQKLITETAESGWDLSQISCPNAVVDYSSDGQSFHSSFTAGDTTARVTLAAGDEVTCTYTNTKVAKLTVVKDAVPDSSQTFGFDVSGAGISQADQSFSLFDDGNDPNGTEHTKGFTFHSGDLGEKIISETAESGWDLSSISCPNANVEFSSDGQAWHGTFASGDTKARVTLAAGDDVTCTYTNTKVAKLTVVKNAVPDSSQTFGFEASGAGIGQADQSFSLFDDGNDPNGTEHTKAFTFKAGDFGQKIITETRQTGWDLTQISCPNATVDYSADGQTWHGTFTSGDTKARVTLAAGDDVTCTYTNTKRGSALIAKVADPADSSATFNFRTTSLSPANPTLDGNGNANDGTPSSQSWDLGAADFGTKIVSEDPKAGWDLTGIDCGNADVTFGSYDGQTFTADPQGNGKTWHPGDNAFRVTIGAGDVVSCTFHNTQRGSVTIKKVNNGGNQNDSFRFTPSNQLSANGFSLKGGEQNKIDNVVPDASGAYTVSEAASAGYRLTSVSCDDSDSTTSGRTATIRVSPGEDVTCTFTNTPVNPQIAAQKTGPATATAGDLVPYTITVTNPTADVPLHNVTVADPRCTTPVTLQSQSKGDGTPDADNILNPGDVWVYVCSVQTASSDQRVDNVATACGNDEFDRKVCDDAPASTVLAQQVVAGDRIVAGEARLSGKSGCVTRAFKVKIRGKQIDRAVIRIDGKRRAVLHPRIAGQTLVFKVNPRKFKAGSHLLTAKTFFVAASNTKPKTMKLRFARCIRRTAPAFTG